MCARIVERGEDAERAESPETSELFATASQSEQSERAPGAVRHRPLRRSRVGEALVVAVTLALALALRLALAARGWPTVNSDQATFGLMVNDILHGRAFPIFFYGQHYLGALQAYLDAPLFALMGPNSFTLHFALTLQTLLAFLVLYAFTRMVYSPLVAWGTLALLALGPTQSLDYELYPGTHTQDILLYGALLLWLTMLRLRQPLGATCQRTKIALLFCIGVAAGLGFWGTFLVTPFIVVALAALVGYRALSLRRRWLADRDAAALRRNLWGAAREAGMFIAGAWLALIPFLEASFASHWVVVHEVFSAAGGGVKETGSPSLIERLIAYAHQAAGVFFVGLPSMFYRSALCPACVPWPAPSAHATPQQAWQAALICAPISLLAIGFWLLAALPLARDSLAAGRRIITHWRQRRAEPAGVASVATIATVQPSTGEDLTTDAQPFEPRWWGRWMLVTAAALSVLIYLTSNAAYLYPGTSDRYLLGLYLCWPLLAAPLWQGAATLVGMLRRRWQTMRAQIQGFRRLATFSAAHARSLALPTLATITLIAVCWLNIIGIQQSIQVSANRQVYGVPAGIRDTQVIAFLEAHHADRFYTTYWTCYRLMFESGERLTCSVVNNANPFAPGFNRIPAYMALVGRSAHPAYVFDTTTHEVTSQVIDLVAMRIAADDPPFSGYRRAMLNAYVIYYFAGG